MNWQERAGKGGVCNFRENYEFFFKWLSNKVCSAFIIRDNSEDKSFTESINWDYFKLNLILDGSICVTDFNNKLYSCIGNPGGEPDEYYKPTIFTVSNPILGSKQVRDGIDGVVIYNTAIDSFAYTGHSFIFDNGLYNLISQTATLLADNIISINCNQINSRVLAFVTADSESQAVAGEAVMKRMYAGKPYQILRSDMIDKINVNPLNTSSVGTNLTQLVELHNYIVANFFQSIGVKSNNVMKRERLINSEIDSQNDYLKISLLEILTSWQAGFDKVNELYGTDISVNLNPALLDELLEDSTSDEMVNGEVSVNELNSTENSTEINNEIDSVEDSEGNDTTEDSSTNNEDSNTITEEPEKDIIEVIKDESEQVSELIDFINDVEEPEEETQEEEVQEDEDSETSETES